MNIVNSHISFQSSPMIQHASSDISLSFAVFLDLLYRYLAVCRRSLANTKGIPLKTIECRIFGVSNVFWEYKAFDSAFLTPLHNYALCITMITEICSAFLKSSYSANDSAKKSLGCFTQFSSSILVQASIRSSVCASMISCYTNLFTVHILAWMAPLSTQAHQSLQRLT